MDSPATEAALSATGSVVDIAQIMHAIPHRYPFLMIDRVVDVVPNQSAVGIKNVSETLGPEAAGKVVYFMSIEGAKFRRPVVPGDQLRIHVTKERNRGNVWKFHAVARVDEISVAEATYAAMIMDRAAAPGISPYSCQNHR